MGVGECTLCQEGYVLQTIPSPYEITKNITQCIKATCLPGTYLYEGATVRDICQSCIANCVLCNNGLNCTICSVGYYPHPSTGICVAESTAAQNLTFYIATAVSTVPTADVAAAEAKLDIEDGSWAKPFTQLIKAVNMVYANFHSYSSVNVTLLLTKGEHFMIYCAYGVDHARVTGGGYSEVRYCDPARVNEYRTSSPSTNNINFVVKPLSCAYKTQLGSPAGFDGLCVDLSSTTNRPVVNVNSAYLYFNVTAVMIFEDLVFAGDNALSQVTHGDRTEHQRAPLKLCTVTSTSPTNLTAPITVDQKN